MIRCLFYFIGKKSRSPGGLCRFILQSIILWWAESILTSAEIRALLAHSSVSLSVIAVFFLVICLITPCTRTASQYIVRRLNSRTLRRNGSRFFSAIQESSQSKQAVDVFSSASNSLFVSRIFFNSLLFQ